jgi:hypothetical protein
VCSKYGQVLAGGAELGEALAGNHTLNQRKCGGTPDRHQKVTAPTRWANCWSTYFLNVVRRITGGDGAGHRRCFCPKVTFG